ncbi:transglycosylase domain-containing protein [Aureispira anguillae]|uniref:Transglycosylase domain-containing protein n=1 Tax=Aureispira anguillae TaxID=2864201 RepID=A0A915YKG6_9BACT|nr:transglycosylase domain-containing protein [Aureispira anguillae]BDS14863.1 transglycosylase domain-containing protein [Aureispira anguillae]
MPKYIEDLSEQSNPSDVRLIEREKRVAKYQNFIKWMWRLYALGILLAIGIFVMLSFDLPSFEELENPRSRIASNIYSSDHAILGKYYIENRTPVEYDSLSPHLINALIATEDARYLEHSGIDAEALGRVFVKTLILQQSGAGGGSTISQQLAKLLVGRPNTKNKGTIKRAWLLVSTKLKEWLTAVRLERSYTKQEIIALYFNEFDFLYGANGIKSAAEIYYDKHPYDLSITEAAMLVRMLKNPSLYNPRRHVERASKGREQVLKNMQIKGHITEAEYHKLRVTPVEMSKFRVKDHNDGIATYFRMYLRDYLKKLLVQLAKDNPQFQKPDGTPYDIYRDGLKIYTTIDSRVQRHAEKAALDHLKEHQTRLFKTWSDWNHPNPPINSKIKNPWTRKTSKNTDAEMNLRRLGLLKQVWGSPRYQKVRSKFMPTAVAHKLRDIDIDRLFQIVEYDKKPKRKNRYSPWVDGKALLKKWEETGFISSKQAQNYKDILTSKAIDSLQKQNKAIMDYMKTPVQTTVFAYNKRGEKDTLMSPFDSIRYHRMHLQTGMLALEPTTGAIKAWVGGINHKYFKFDHVNKDQAARQVGSTIKPFLYALTVDLKGYSPCFKVWDQPTTISKGEGQFGLLKDWTPKNAGGFSGDEITLTEALNRSLNSVSAYLMKELKGPEPFRNFLADVGIDTSNGRVPTSAALCLGVPNLSPFEMAGGYTIFANKGTYTEPIFIDRIEDKNGNLIYSAGQDQRSEAILSEQGAYVMNQMLQRIQRGRLRGVKSSYGGKTGTTNFQADGWFMGITPDLVVGTWVGCDDRYIRFRSLTYGQGAKMARPIFRNVLLNMEADSTLREDNVFNPNSRFPIPEIIEREMDCLKYNQFTEESIKDKGNDATNTDVYGTDEDF